MPRLAQSLTPQRKEAILSSIKNLISKTLYKALSVLLTTCCDVEMTSLEIIPTGTTNQYRLRIETTNPIGISTYFALNITDTTSNTLLGGDGFYVNGIVTSQIFTLTPGDNLEIGGIILYFILPNFQGRGVFIPTSGITGTVPPWVL